MAPKTPKPPDKSKTVAPARGAGNGLDRRNSWRLTTRFEPGDRHAQPPENGGVIHGPGDDSSPAARRVRLDALAREWILDLRVLGRSPRTIGWYQQKVDAFLIASGAVTLTDLTAFELKRHVLELQDRGLAANTIFDWHPGGC